jgi:hypothetical protein
MHIILKFRPYYGGTIHAIRAQLPHNWKECGLDKNYVYYLITDVPLNVNPEDVLKDFGSWDTKGNFDHDHIVPYEKLKNKIL